MSTDGKITRKIKQGKAELDYDGPALIINFEVEVVRLDENGRVSEVLDRLPENKRIKLKSLTPEKNMATLASDIIQQCKYIHPSRAEEIEQLLIKLRKYVLANPVVEVVQEVVSSNKKDKYDNKDRGSNRNDREVSRQREEPQEEILPPVSMDELDDYLDLLYHVAGKNEKEDQESQKSQVLGTAKILKLCRDVMNLEQLIQNGTVMGALTRVLQEEYKKSLDLTFNIFRIFLAFSNFMEMHGLMANYKIGLLTMKALEFEVKRFEHRDYERQQKEQEYDKEIQQLKEKGLNMEEKTKLIDRIKRKKDKDSITFKKQQLIQEKLFFVGFYILVNLAEDVTVEKKMLKKNLTESLINMLDRNYEDLLILSVTFLKKLSIFDENKETFKTLNLVGKLVRFIPCSSQALVNSTLRLLFNLSFDEELRDQMMRAGLVPKIIQLLKTPAFRAKTLKLLYHLSVDDRCKSMVTYTDGITLLMGMVINFPQKTLAKELAALMVNLSYNTRNVELMIANHGLNHLMDRLENTQDPLLLKIIRNITLWSFNQQQELEQPEIQYKFRGLWSPHIKILLSITRESDNHDVLVEVFGCLANLTSFDLPANSSWLKITRDYNFINQFSKMLVPGMSQNDLILEIVMTISAISSDGKCCELIASSNLIGMLYQLWKEKADDVELRLQLIHLFHNFFMNEASREEAMYSTRIVVDIIDCLSHKNFAVRQAADSITEIVLELDRKINGELGQLGMQIRKKRFEGYNMQWLQEVGIIYDNSNMDDDLDLFNPNLNYGDNHDIMSLSESKMDNDFGGYDAKIDSDWRKFQNSPYICENDDSRDDDDDDDDA
jgi:hypothetical protein